MEFAHCCVCMYTCIHGRSVRGALIAFECETSGYDYLFGFYILNAVIHGCMDAWIIPVISPNVTTPLTHARHHLMYNAPMRTHKIKNRMRNFSIVSCIHSCVLACIHAFTDTCLHVYTTDCIG